MSTPIYPPSIFFENKSRGSRVIIHGEVFQVVVASGGINGASTRRFRQDSIASHDETMMSHLGTGDLRAVIEQQI
jgi:hypothetical protein